MNPYGPRRGPRPLFFLVPLIIGIGLGALFFGPSRGPWLYDDWREYGPSRQRFDQPPQPAQPAPPAQPAQPQAAPQAPHPRFMDRGPGWHDDFGWKRHHGPFGGLGLLLPLLLIGTGAWLFFGRRRGPQNWGGPGHPGGPAQWSGPANVGPQQYAQPAPPPAGPYTPPSPPSSPPPPSEPMSGRAPEPPATGETRIL